jgi:hypothetical protein
MAAELELKSPSVPLFQRGNFFLGFSPLFEKEGKGRFFGRSGGGNFATNFR